MDYLCQFDHMNGSNPSWIPSTCQGDWINIITSLSVVYLALLLIAYLRRVESNREPTTRITLKNHNFRSGLTILLFLIHWAEAADAFLSKGPYQVFIVPSVSFTVLITLSFFEHLIERTHNTGLILVSGSLWLVNGIARTVRLVVLRYVGVEWDRLRPTTAALSSIAYFLISISDLLKPGEKIETSQTEKPKNENAQYDLQTYRFDGAHFFSKATFYWMNSLLKTGYKSPIELEDLGVLSPDHSAKRLYQELERISQGYESKTPSDFWWLFLTFMKSDFLLGGVFKLFGDLVGVVGPLGISVLVNFVADQKNRTESNYEKYPSIMQLGRNGWTMAFVVFFASIAQSTLSQASTHIVNVKSIHLKVALQSLIYEKSLRLRKYHGGVEKKLCEDNSDIGVLVNLMSNDVTNIMSFFWIGHYIWAIPVKVTVIMFVLYMKLGGSAIIGAVGTILILMPLQLSIGKKMSRNNAAISELSDERLQHLSILIEKIKLFKLLSWENYYTKRILQLRKKELKLLNKDSVFWAILTFFTHASSVLVSVIILGVHYLFSDTPLTSDSVFSTLALINQLMVPLFIFPVIIPTIADALVSCRRISEYFTLHEIRRELEIVTKNDAEGETKKCKIHPLMISIHEEDENRVYESSVEAECEDYGKSDHEETDKEKMNDDLDDINENAELKFSETTEDWIITIENGVFTWQLESPQRTLIIEKLKVLRGEIIMVIGKVGSGKSSLLSAILGEMSRISGSYTSRSDVSVAFCPQTPWLLNSTIRDNILFGLPFRPRRYDQVLTACALKPDLSILPKRDLTEIGEKGINLSGGQRQRIAIARALYSRANLVIMDDPLSSLDLATASTLFEEGIKRLVRRSKRTVIMATHNLQFLADCHLVIVMENGKIKAEGKPSCIRFSDHDLLKHSSSASENNLKERRAKERWQLIKSVARIRRSLRVKDMDNNSWFPEDKMYTPIGNGRFDKYSKWNYITHDLPLPTDEFQSRIVDCSTSWWRNSSKRKGIGRANSLQDRHTKSCRLVRQYSSPLTADTSKLYRTQRGYRKELVHQFLNTSSKKKEDFVPKPPLDRMTSTESGMSDLFIDESTEKEENFINRNLEQRQYGKLKKNVYVSYFLACGLKTVIGYLLVTLTWQTVRVYTDFWLSIWTETSDTSQVFKYLCVYIFLSVSAVILSLISHGLGQYAGSRARRHLHDTMLLNIIRCPNKLFESTPVGRIFNRFSADVEIIDKKLATTIQRLMQFLLFCCSSIVINAVITPWFIVITVPMVLLYYIIQMFYCCSSRELQRLDSITRSPILSHFAETLSGLSSIRAYGYEDKFISSFFTKVNQNTNAFLILNSMNRWLGIVLDYLGGIIVLLAMITTLIAVRVYPDSITPSLVGLATNYTLLVPIYLNWVVKFFVDFEVYLGAVERIRQYMTEPTEKCNPPPAAEAIPSRIIKLGDIKFENVVLSYGSSAEPALMDINLHIPPGQKLGICGRSGSGKSTLALSLFNMLEMHEGVIKIDDLDISKIPLNILRTSGSIIPQDTLLFNGTIRENLDPSGMSTDEQLWSALEQAHLRGLVEDQYEGNLDSDINAGQFLSGGQKQLFSLARAILQESSFLIMDEATSNLDKEFEQILMGTAQKLFHGKTLLIIAHRLSTVLDCDRIIVLDRGRIVEDGSPSNLLNRDRGIFSAMVKSSEEGFLVI